jgi:hypothetical protein
MLVACRGRPSVLGVARDMLDADAPPSPHPGKLWSKDVKKAAIRPPDIDPMMVPAAPQRGPGASSSI